jgi:hypothetical protein
VRVSCRKKHPDVFDGAAVFLYSRSQKCRPKPEDLERARCWAPLCDPTFLSCGKGIVCASFKKFANARLPKVATLFKKFKEEEKEKKKKNKNKNKTPEKATPVGQQKEKEKIPAKPLEKATLVGQQKEKEKISVKPLEKATLVGQQKTKFIDLTIEPSSDEEEKSLSSASSVAVTSPAKRTPLDNRAPMATATAGKRPRSHSTVDPSSGSPKKARVDETSTDPPKPAEVLIVPPPVAVPLMDALLFVDIDPKSFFPSLPVNVAAAHNPNPNPIQVQSAPMLDDAVDMDIGDFAKTLDPPAADKEEKKDEKEEQEQGKPDKEDPMELEKAEELLNKSFLIDADEKKEKAKAPDQGDPMDVEKVEGGREKATAPLLFEPWVTNFVAKDTYVSTYNVSGFSQDRKLRLKVSSGDELFKSIANSGLSKEIVDNLGRASCKELMYIPPDKADSSDLEKLVKLAKPGAFDRPKYFFGVRDHVLKADATCKIALVGTTTVVIHTASALRVFPNPVDNTSTGVLECWTNRGGLTIDDQGMALGSDVHYFCCSKGPDIELTLCSVAGDACLTIAGLTEGTVMPLVSSDPIGAVRFTPYQETAVKWVDAEMKKTRYEQRQLEKGNSLRPTLSVGASETLDLANRNHSSSMDTDEHLYSMHVQAKVVDPKEPNKFSLESKLEYMAFNGQQQQGKGIIIIDGFARSLDLTKPMAELERGGFLTLEPFDPANDDMSNLLKEYRCLNARRADRIALSERIEKLGVALWGPPTNTFRASQPVQAPVALPSPSPALSSSGRAVFQMPLVKF